VPYPRRKELIVGKGRSQIKEKDYLTDAEEKHIGTMSSKEKHYRLFIFAAIVLIIFGCVIVGLTLVLKLSERHLYQGTVCIFIGVYLIIDMTRNKKSLGIIRKLLREERVEER
jgi:uncharacterized membrane protein HdeD (DUF308 family)